MFIATSDIHLKHKLRLSRDEALAEAVRWVRYGREALGPDAEIEFSAEDASRTDVDFLLKVYEAVVDAGATTVNIPDTVGYAIPASSARSSGESSTSSARDATVSVHCHNDLGLATANTLAAVQAGARQVEVTINGLGERAGNASLEEVVMALRTRPTQFPELGSGVQTEQITAASRLVSYLTGFAIQPNKAIVGGNAFAHEIGIHQDGVIKNPLTYEIMTPQSVGLAGSQLTIGKLSGRRGLQGKLRELGHDLEGEALDAIYRQAIALADAKKEVTDADLLALVEQRASEVPASVELLGWSVTSSHGGNATGSVSLTVKGEDRNGGGDRQRAGRRALLRRRPGAPAGPRLAPGADRVRDQGGLGRRGRPGPGARPLPALVGRGSGGAGRLRPRVIDEHHRGVARGLPRRGQQAPRRRDQRRRRRVRRAARRRGALVTEADLATPTIGSWRSRATGSGRRSWPRRAGVLDAAAGGVRLRRSSGARSSPAGTAIDAYGVAIRDEDVAAAGDADAILLGAVGGPKWDDPTATVRPEQALFALRGGLGLFANLRPVTVHPALVASSPLRAGAPRRRRPADRPRADRRDLLRRADGGDRRGRGARRQRHAAVHGARDPARGPARLRARPRPARPTDQRRQGQRPRDIAAVANRSSRRCDAEFPDVELDHQLVDSCAMLLVKSPAWFDVLVTENLFGDILSDEAAVLAG